MYRLFLVINLICFSAIAVAQQTATGSVIDAYTEQVLGGVEIVNLQSKATAVTDAKGNFSINAKEGESISFSLEGYDKNIAVIGNNHSIVVGMTPAVISIDSVEINNDLTRYQKDSIERYLTYRHLLDRHDAKAQIRTRDDQGPKTQGFGLTINNPISSLAGGKKAKNRRRFQENFAKMEAQKRREAYSRYQPALVQQLTGLSEMETNRFMQHYPISTEFDAVVSDLELQSWIMDNFKKWKKNE